ncbi:hypothetical protein [Dokdonella immobilis]|uniref:Uncharacterized protein n=1 Tax=Dokdonella immobilis TaxID=578942 RepID=A0A1I4ZZK0_9GAMM|nr:hypothetical protein [Dokdonella immobilis]SFN55567.1 hypothetical protein SAMN05216289_13044 [Dokdonella immobilis]
MNRLDSRQAIVDDEHLKLLALGYLFSGVMTALFSLLGLVYAVMGLLMSTLLAAAARSGSHAGSLPPQSLGAVFGIFGLVFFVIGASLAIAKFMAAARIRRRRARTFCLVVAGVSCLGIPYGTVLGVCTFMVLGRDSVVRLFAAPEAP